VLGLTTCRTGCVGSGTLTPEYEAQARRSVDPALTAVPPGADPALALVVMLRWRDPAVAHPCARLTAIEVGGRTVTGLHGDWLAGISSTRPGTGDC
jgi:hypothetical protein